ncbi:MAG: beta-N-acetylhexosaminidase [Myxococcaceae bacterium]|jgi:beta-N-acetylhexosaminidase|nr:beta-N-acetylhexosaminidase [Myxococcaceae bacterium]
MSSSPTRALLLVTVSLLGCSHERVGRATSDQPFWQTKAAPARAPTRVDAPTPRSVQAAAPALEGEAEARLARLSVDDKLGQLLMVGFDGYAVDETVSGLLKGRRVGGVCLFKRNIQSAEQVARLNDDVRALFEGQLPPFIAVDQEGGNVVRLSDRNVVLPGNMVLGATRDGQLAYEAGRAQGNDLRRLGFTMNLAPVLDVNSNPRNPVIGIRAFSDDVGLVSELGAQFVKGQQAARIVTVAKHFPGHGGVDSDSHKALPVVTLPEAALRRQLEPFVAAMHVGLDGLMTAHIATPTLAHGDATPATLSSHVLGNVLRDELGFQGLVVTDELEMDAIDARWGVGHAAVMAVNAGADMVLVPWREEKIAEVAQALRSAVDTGVLSMARVDEAVRRIIEAKLRRGVFEPLPPRAERLASLGAEQEVVTRIASAAVTLLKADRRVLPLPAGRKVAVLTAERALATALEARVPLVRSVVVPAFAPAAARSELKRQAQALAQQSDVVVVGVVNAQQLELVTVAGLTGKPVVVVVMGAPYLGTQVPGASAVLSVYSYRDSMAEAAARALTGSLAPAGRLPVAMPRMPFGFGLDFSGKPLPDVARAEVPPPAAPAQVRAND